MGCDLNDIDEMIKEYKEGLAHYQEKVGKEIALKDISFETLQK